MLATTLRYVSNNTQMAPTVTTRQVKDLVSVYRALRVLFQVKNGRKWLCQSKAEVGRGKTQEATVYYDPPRFKQCCFLVYKSQKAQWQNCKPGRGEGH